MDLTNKIIDIGDEQLLDLLTRVIKDDTVFEDIDAYLAEKNSGYLSKQVTYISWETLEKFVLLLKQRHLWIHLDSALKSVVNIFVFVNNQNFEWSHEKDWLTICRLITEALVESCCSPSVKAECLRKTLSVLSTMTLIISNVKPQVMGNVMTCLSHLEQTPYIFIHVLKDFYSFSNTSNDWAIISNTISSLGDYKSQVYVTKFLIDRFNALVGLYTWFSKYSPNVRNQFLQLTLSDRPELDFRRFLSILNEEGASVIFVRCSIENLPEKTVWVTINQGPKTIDITSTDYEENILWCSIPFSNIKRINFLRNRNVYVIFTTTLISGYLSTNKVAISLQDCQNSTATLKKFAEAIYLCRRVYVSENDTDNLNLSLSFNLHAENREEGYSMESSCDISQFPGTPGNELDSSAPLLYCSQDRTTFIGCSIDKQPTDADGLQVIGDFDYQIGPLDLLSLNKNVEQQTLPECSEEEMALDMQSKSPNVCYDSQVCKPKDTLKTPMSMAPSAQENTTLTLSKTVEQPTLPECTEKEMVLDMQSKSPNALKRSFPMAPCAQGNTTLSVATGDIINSRNETTSVDKNIFADSAHGFNFHLSPVCSMDMPTENGRCSFAEEPSGIKNPQVPMRNYCFMKSPPNVCEFLKGVDEVDEFHLESEEVVVDNDIDVLMTQDIDSQIASARLSNDSTKVTGIVEVVDSECNPITSTATKADNLMPANNSESLPTPHSDLKSYKKSVSFNLTCSEENAINQCNKDNKMLYSNFVISDNNLKETTSNCKERSRPTRKLDYLNPFYESNKFGPIQNRSTLEVNIVNKNVEFKKGMEKSSNKRQLPKNSSSNNAVSYCPDIPEDVDHQDFYSLSKDASVEIIDIEDDDFHALTQEASQKVILPDTFDTYDFQRSAKEASVEVFDTLGDNDFYRFAVEASQQLLDFEKEASQRGFDSSFSDDDFSNTTDKREETIWTGRTRHSNRLLKSVHSNSCNICPVNPIKRTKTRGNKPLLKICNVRSPNSNKRLKAPKSVPSKCPDSPESLFKVKSGHWKQKLDILLQTKRNRSSHDPFNFPEDC